MNLATTSRSVMDPALTAAARANTFVALRRTGRCRQIIAIIGIVQRMSADLRKEPPPATVGAGSRADKPHLVCAEDASITESGASLPTEEVERIVQSRHDMPFRVLGPHPADHGRLTV